MFAVLIYMKIVFHKVQLVKYIAIDVQTLRIFRILYYSNHFIFKSIKQFSTVHIINNNYT